MPSAEIKYPLRNLLVFITVLGVMAATLRVSSPRSVLIMLACVCGLLCWAAAASTFAVGKPRQVFAAAAITGCLYLICYVVTDTPIETWINSLSMMLFAGMKGDLVPAPPGNSMEFQYFQQKMHLILAVISACLAAWIANA